MLIFHRKMLADEGRTNAYREAIRRVVSDRVVLDVGCGTGILALLACEAGARRVFAIEREGVADVAAFLVRQLGHGGRIEIIHDHSSKVVLPEPADVLVTETLGEFGLDEQILGSVIDARGRLLRPDGRIIPERLRLSIVPVDVPEAFDRYVAWWSERRYGFDLSTIAVLASNTVFGLDIASSAHLSTPKEIITIDFSTVVDAQVEGSTRMTIARDGTLHGFGGWFTATLCPGLELSNAQPGATHWSQVFLPLQRPIPVKAGTVIDVALHSNDGKSWRWKGLVHDTPPVPFDQATWFGTLPCTHGSTARKDVHGS